MLIRPADQYAVVAGRAPNAVRITLPGNVPHAALDRGIEVLAGLLADPPADMAV